MPRAERMLELAERLRASEATTAERLASELAVSIRTVRRDLASLRQRGMPITGEAGPGGGIRLEGDRGVTAVHLSLAEVVTLWLAARLSQAASDLPWGGSASAALAKLLGSLPRERARALRALCRRVIVGPPASSHVATGAGRPPAELLRLFEETFTAGIGLAFSYRDRDGRPTLRRIEPHGLLVQSPVWYVLARDVDKGVPRMFRMDRISHPRVARDIAFRPDHDVIWEQLPPAYQWHPLQGDGR